ncbi:hypothetical protein IGI04_025422 [Brassica rapa subsp. trilocularis]|uniref:Uncharacterized protein n=1 Tax=Brassica rapa subsp. trilocularis TaxID=1813537 RepID=A0ABQ7KT17_BRACM|nr:hypothetical protein IGI04_025422 [Brassica rapa subsp. trilocularis]
MQMRIRVSREFRRWDSEDYGFGEKLIRIHPYQDGRDGMIRNRRGVVGRRDLTDPRWIFGYKGKIGSLRCWESTRSWYSSDYSRVYQVRINHRRCGNNGVKLGRENWGKWVYYKGRCRFMLFSITLSIFITKEKLREQLVGSSVSILCVSINSLIILMRSQFIWFVFLHCEVCTQWGEDWIAVGMLLLHLHLGLWFSLTFSPSLSQLSCLVSLNQIQTEKRTQSREKDRNMFVMVVHYGYRVTKRPGYHLVRDGSWISEEVYGYPYMGVMWRLMEPNIGHKDGFDLQQGCDLLNYQAVLNSNKIQTFYFCGVIPIWNFVKLWKQMRTGVVDLECESYLYELHVKLIRRTCMLFYSCKLPCCNYMELWSKRLFNGVIGFMTLYSSELIILFPCKAIHYGWPKGFLYGNSDVSVLESTLETVDE